MFYDNNKARLYCYLHIVPVAKQQFNSTKVWQGKIYIENSLCDTGEMRKKFHHPEHKKKVLCHTVCIFYTFYTKKKIKSWKQKFEIDFPCSELKCETVFPTNKWKMCIFYQHYYGNSISTFYFKHRSTTKHIYDNSDITSKTQPLIHSTILSAFNHGQKKRVFKTKAAVIWQTASVMEFMYRCVCWKNYVKWGWKHLLGCSY